VLSLRGLEGEGDREEGSPRSFLGWGVRGWRRWEEYIEEQYGGGNSSCSPTERGWTPETGSGLVSMCGGCQIMKCIHVCFSEAIR
jgi:hypothetical protein